MAPLEYLIPECSLPLPPFPSSFHTSYLHHTFLHCSIALFHQSSSPSLSLLRTDIINIYIFPWVCCFSRSSAFWLLLVCCILGVWVACISWSLGLLHFQEFGSAVFPGVRRSGCFWSAVFSEFGLLAFPGVWVCCIFRSLGLLAFSGVWRLAFGSDFLHLVIYPNASLTVKWCWGLILQRRPTSSNSFCFFSLSGF